MNLRQQNLPYKSIKSIIKTRKSIKIQPKLLDIILYQQKMLLEHQSFLSCCFFTFPSHNTSFLEQGFKQAYTELSLRDQTMYYEASVNLGKQLDPKMLEKKKSSEELPKYPWDKEYEKQSQPKLQFEFFEKTTIFYEQRNSSLAQTVKIYLEVLSAEGHYMEMRRLNQGRYRTSSQQLHVPGEKISNQNSYKSKVIVIDLREYLLHRQPHQENRNLDFFIISKFIHPGELGQNRVISSDEGIHEIFFDIRRYYQYKSKKFTDFYLYSYIGYIKRLLQLETKIGMEILFKAKNTSSSLKNYITSIQFLNGLQEQETQRKFISFQPQNVQDQHPKINFLLHTHFNQPLDLASFSNRHQYLQHIPIHKKNQNLWIDWKKNQSNLLVYTNEQKLSVQKSITKQTLKLILTNLFSKKSVYSASLPVITSDNLSLVQKICRCLGYAPLAFAQISSSESNKYNLHLQIKGIMTVMIGFSTLQIQEMLKPFNSVLGQTYQGFINGCPVYAEQINHQPSITSFFMKGIGYYIYGSLEPKVSFGINKATGSNQGSVSVAFSDKQIDQNVMRFIFPNTQMGGLIMGKRTIKMTGASYILCQKRNLLGIIQWGPKFYDSKLKNHKTSHQKINPSQQDYFQGKVFKILDSMSLNKQNFQHVKQNYYEQQILSFNGNWTESLLINQFHQFDFETQIPYQCMENPVPLPSHSNLRSDILLQKYNQITQSQKGKQIIKNNQRQDYELRQQNPH